MRTILLLISCLYLIATNSLAQVKSSAITGVVTDASGAVIPNASVTVTNQDTNVSTEVKTSGTGAYTVPYLPAGRYSVAVQAEGFQVYRKTDIVMGTGTTVRADAELVAGSVRSSIEVKADAAVLQTESASVQSVVSQELISNIPNVNNNPLYYATLSAGVVPTTQMYEGSNLGVGYSGRQSMSAIRINGGMLGNSDVQLDGLSVQGSAWHEAAILPDRDALQEVRVITNNFSADLGNGQGVISMTTKSGTNEYHGSLHYRMRNEALNANGLYNNSHSIRRSKYRLNEGGGTIGGPVIIPKVFNGKDKLFFFASFSRLTHSDPVNYLAKVPTALERQGDFSQTKVADNSGSPAAVQIFDPFSATSYQGSSTVFQRVAYPNAVIANANKYGLKILQSYPMPNHTPSTVYNTDNYYFSGNTPTARNNLASRLDYRMGDRHSLYMSGGLEKASSTPPNRWGDDSIFVNMASPGLITDDNPYVSVGDTITLSPTTVVDLRYGLTRIKTKASYPGGDGFDYSAYGMPESVQKLIALPGAAPTIGNFVGSGNRGGYANLNDDGWTRKNEAQLNHALTGSVTRMQGRWTFKFGGEYRVYLGNWQDLLFGTPSLGWRTATNTGTAQFTDAYGAYSSLNTNPIQRGLDFATALTGVTGYYLTAGTSATPALASKYAAIFTQNDWKATDRLTINLGLRYEVQPGPTERYNRGSSLDLSRVNPYAPSSLSGGSSLASMGMIVFPRVDGYSRNLWNTQWSDISPRVGIAYRVNETTVLRGGYGRVYTPSNTGFNANGLIYGTGPFAGGADANAYGTTGNNGTPIGTFDQPQSTLIYPATGVAQSPTIYGNQNAAQGVDLFLRDGFHNGRMDQWNFFIQQSFGKSLLISAGYVGSHGSNLPWRARQLTGTWSVGQSTLNSWRSDWLSSNALSDPAQKTVTNPFTALVGKASGSIGKSTITNLVSQQPYLGMFGQTAYTSEASSNYNALELHVKRSTDSLQIMAHYTWSKTTGINGGATGSTFAESQMRRSLATQSGIDYRNLENNNALLSYDAPHRFVGVVSYLLPTGRGKALDPGNRVVRALVGEWDLGSVVTLQSGQPWGPSCSGTLNGRCNINPGESVELPENLQGWYDGKTKITLPSGRVIMPSAYTFVKWNPDLFSQPVVQLPNGKWQVDQYQWGATSSTLGWLRMPMFANVNLTVARQFNIHERAQLEFTAEATNLFNRTSFRSNALNSTVSSALSANSSTNTRVGQNGNVSFGSLSMAFMDPRQVVLSLRMRF